MLFVKTRQLTEEEFESTFTPPMKDVTSVAEEVVNVWPYIEKVFSAEFDDAETGSWDVEYVYVNKPESHQHILVNTQMENAYLVIVVDVKNKAIYGHHFLNLNQKYGLTH